MKHILAGLPCLLIALSPSAAGGQTLSLEAARTAAAAASPDVRLAREAVTVARGRERQAAAWQNPVLGWSHEQTSAGGQSNSQNIVALDVPLELTGQRGARVAAARLRRQAAEASLAWAMMQAEFDVTRAYALVVAADRRAALAASAAESFTEALRASEQRVSAGDQSGYAHRRLRLEAARYAVLRGDAELARRTARLNLAALIQAAGESAASEWVLSDSLRALAIPAAAESLVSVALAGRPDLRAAALEADALTESARLARRERIPVPTLTAGLKDERVLGGGPALSGFVVGVSLPLPVFDRRAGLILASDAEQRGRLAAKDALVIRITREVREAVAGVRAAAEQVELIAPRLGEEARAALASVRLAYAEGEVSLVEWLDAVRAYQESETGLAALRAELFIRHAALARAVGASPITGRGADR